ARRSVGGEGGAARRLCRGAAGARPEDGKAREAGRMREQSRPRAVARRDARRARQPEDRRASARCRQDGGARRREGRQDARDRQGARPRRDHAWNRSVQSRLVDVLGAVQSPRVLRGLQTRGRAHDAAPLRAAAVAQAASCQPALGNGCRGCLNGGRILFSSKVMPTFHNGAVEIAYLDEGHGEPIVLVHGFASNKEVNWVQPGWVATLTRAGRRVIALDDRGHGQSTKLYNDADYHTDLMAGDVAALIEHLKLGRADVMGYSLGARICAVLAVRHPDSVRSAILGGAGIRLVHTAGLRDEIADSLEAPSIDEVSDPMGRTFRLFAEQTRSDLKALA